MTRLNNCTCAYDKKTSSMLFNLGFARRAGTVKAGPSDHHFPLLVQLVAVARLHLRGPEGSRQPR